MRASATALLLSLVFNKALQPPEGANLAALFCGKTGFRQ